MPARLSAGTVQLAPSHELKLLLGLAQSLDMSFKQDMGAMISSSREGHLMKRSPGMRKYLALLRCTETISLRWDELNMRSNSVV